MRGIIPPSACPQGVVPGSAQGEDRQATPCLRQRGEEPVFYGSGRKGCSQEAARIQAEKPETKCISGSLHTGGSCLAVTRDRPRCHVFGLSHFQP
jgi:hypothetical protein